MLLYLLEKISVALKYELTVFFLSFDFFSYFMQMTATLVLTKGAILNTQIILRVVLPRTLKLIKLAA